MKNNNILFLINFITLTLCLITSLFIGGLGLQYLILGLFSIFLYAFESRKLKSSLFDSMILLFTLPLLFIILFNGEEPFFLFLDDKYYFSQAKYESLRSYADLFQSFFFELDLDFNNYLYLLSIYFKTFGYHQYVYFFVNFVCLIRIFSFITKDKIDVEQISIIKWIPLELVLFSFFCFKDILICFLVTEFVRNSLKVNFVIFLILSAILIFTIEPLRVGYSYLFILLIGISNYTDLFKSLSKIPFVLPIWLFFVILQVFLTNVIDYSNGNLIVKIYYYVDSLANRLRESSGFLSLFYSSFYSGNIFAGLLIICFTVFIPVFNLPDNHDNADILFMIFRLITLFQYLLLLFTFKKFNHKNSNYITAITLVFLSLTIIHLTFAPGMLRHSLIILPFLYSLLIHLNNEKKIASFY